MLCESKNGDFNVRFSGYCAFTHKAGIHAKAILNNPSTYEILKPEDFGLTRYVSIGHRLTGWNAVKSRVEQLGLKLTDDEVSPHSHSSHLHLLTFRRSRTSPPRSRSSRTSARSRWTTSTPSSVSTIPVFSPAS